MNTLEARLAPTPFWDLVRDTNNWLLFRGRAYLISFGECDDNMPSLVLDGTTCALEECETMNFLEERYIGQQSSLVDMLLSEEEKRLVQRENERYWHTLASLAGKELVKRYTLQNPEKDKGEDTFIKAPLDSYKPASERILKRPHLLLERKCVELKAVRKDEALKEKSWLTYKGKWYCASEYPEASALEDKLKRTIGRELRRTIKRHLEECQGEAEYTACHVTVNNLSKECVTFIYSIDPYILRKRGKYYHFPKTELSLDVRRKGNSIVIPGPAEVTLPYLHPLVYADGSICYNTHKRFHRQGIYFTQSYNCTKIETIGRMIAALLDEAAKTLHLGYLKDVNPVVRLSDQLFERFRCSEQEAEDSEWIIYRQ